MPNYNLANVPHQPAPIWADLLARDWTRHTGAAPLSIHWINENDAICLIDINGVPYILDITDYDDALMLWQSEYGEPVELPLSEAFHILNDDPQLWESKTLSDLPND